MANIASKKTIIILAVIAGVIVVLIWIFTRPIYKGTVASEDIALDENLAFEQELKDIKVPEMGDELEDKTVAVPEVISKAAPGVEAKFRRFSIVADKDAFTPSEVIVNQGDTVHINVAAVDKTYDIVFPDYGMKQIISAGETKVLEFQAVRPGKFLYYCDLCGGLESKVSGHIIVVPKE